VDVVSGIGEGAGAILRVNADAAEADAGPLMGEQCDSHGRSIGGEGA
jgi:hypothetical protein